MFYLFVHIKQIFIYCLLHVSLWQDVVSVLVQLLVLEGQGRYETNMQVSMRSPGQCEGAYQGEGPGLTLGQGNCICKGPSSSLGMAVARAQRAMVKVQPGEWVGPRGF